MNTKAQIPKAYRQELFAQWSAERTIGPDAPEQPQCPLCVAAIHRRKADPEGGDLCDYCPAEWLNKAGGYVRDCCAFMTAAIGDAALAGRILYGRAAHARGRPVTMAEYDEARRRVLARIEWTP